LDIEDRRRRKVINENRLRKRGHSQAGKCQKRGREEVSSISSERTGVSYRTGEKIGRRDQG